jgi:hypothetical protein
MKRLPLLSLFLIATLGVGCSKSSQEDAPAPTEQMQVKKHTQALTGITLQEVPVSAEVLAAAGEGTTVRAFHIEAAEGVSASVEELVTAALEEGGSDPVNLPWQAGVERDREETRLALKYLEELVPTIEAQVGTDEEYRSGYRHWMMQTAQDFCGHGDFYGLVFQQAGMLFIIEATGGTEC